MASVRRFWHRATQTANVVEMGISTNGAGHINNIIGVWDATANAYYFDFPDTTAVAVYDESKGYTIWDNTSPVLIEISIGALQTAVGLAAHIGAAAAHGATGAVVGTTNAQTLTGKTIDGASNTLSLKPSQMKASSDSALPAAKIKPDAGQDTELFVDTASATVLTMQAANDAKSADRELTIKAGVINLQTRTGAAIKIKGIAAAAATGEAVRYDELAALTTRVGNLEVGGAWVPTASVSCTLKPLKRQVKIMWGMNSAANNGNAARYEVFYGENAYTLAAGATLSDDLDYLRQNFNRVVLRGNEGRSISVWADSTIYVIVVAFDATGSAYNSATKDATPQEDERFLSVAGAKFTTAGGGISQVRVAASGAGSVAAVPTDCSETSASPFIKIDADYDHIADTLSLVVGFHAYQATPAMSALVTLNIINLAGAVQKTQTINVNYAAGGFEPYSTTMDLTGLAAGKYRIQASIQIVGGGTAHLRGDMVIIPKNTVTV